jgi:YidC/Oxa1 family membrane protein insertase
MEKRLLIAIVLSFLVLFAYQALFVNNEPPPQSEPLVEPKAVLEPQPDQPSESKPEVQKSIPPQNIPEETAESFEPVSAGEEKTIVVDTNLYRAEWSNKGAVLKSWTLKQHKDEDGNPMELVTQTALDISYHPFSIMDSENGLEAPANQALFQTKTQNLNFRQADSATVNFVFSDSSGNRISKTFTFHPDSYAIEIQIETWSGGRKTSPMVVWGPSIVNDVQSEDKRFGQEDGAAIFSADNVNRIKEKDYEGDTGSYNFVQWAAYEGQYFTALMLTQPQQASAVFFQKTIDESPYYFLGASHIQQAFIGPKQYDLLSAFGHQANKLVKFGFFGFIAEILYKAIKAIHQAVPNWGFSIIILTIIIKIIFFPLTYSSTKSMAKMQELQPKIKALRNKYKKAKQDIEQRRRLNEETMKLYKEHGVNPAGGCLPILIQLPIFWGFFRLLIVAVEFRHSPFILWVNDLSVKDPFYVTPILMGITQFISQKMTPTSADPTQRKMMLIMPVVMTVFFMNFQSGLVLYWLTNNVLQIGQQYIMNRFMHKEKRETHGKGNKK